MSLIVPLLLSSLAISPLVYSIAVPSNAKPVSYPVLDHREPIASPGLLQLGDLLSFQNGQLLRRNNDSAGFEVYAVEPRFEEYNKIAPLSRRADDDPVYPDLPPDADQFDEEDEGVFKCGDTKVFIGKLIDSGGSGDVYKAITKEGKLVAMKGMNVEAERDREWDMVHDKVGEHNNIVKFFNKCKVGAKYYIMMELITGTTLQNSIDAQLYTQAEALAKVVIGQVFDAVDHMHSKGVAHQDLKGGNVLFGEAERVVVIDFGMATTETKVSDISVAGGIRAPEAELKSTMEIDPQANDVWELGVILVSMLIGKKPWTDAGAKNAQAIWKKQAPSQRATACLGEWKQFSQDFCDILAGVFAEQLSRKPLSTFKTKVMNPNLKIFQDDCNKKTTKREAEAGEMVVTSVRDLGEELVVRAVMY